MKIGILTWHKECNHGAVLQAYASQEMLKKLIEVASQKNVLEKYLYISLRHKDRCDDEITRPNKYLEDINDVAKSSSDRSINDDDYDIKIYDK